MRRRDLGGDVFRNVRFHVIDNIQENVRDNFERGVTP